MTEQQTRDRLDLIREALRILDGEAPEELVVEGDGWSLVNPDAVAQDTASEATTVVSVPEPPSREPVGDAPGASLLGAISAALDEAVNEGWMLGDESPTEAAAPRRGPHNEDSSELDAGWTAPADSSEEHRAVFAAGESMAAAMHASGGLADYDEQSPQFWRRFWAKSA